MQMSSRTNKGEWDTVGTKPTAWEDHFLGRRFYQALLLIGVLPVPIWEKTVLSTFDILMRIKLTVQFLF